MRDRSLLHPYQHFLLTTLLQNSDLGSRAHAEDAASALYEVWNCAMARDCKVLAMTVPDCAMKVSWLDAGRSMLNHMILTHEDPN